MKRKEKRIGEKSLHFRSNGGNEKQEKKGSKERGGSSVAS